MDPLSPSQRVSCVLLSKEVSIDRTTTHSTSLTFKASSRSWAHIMVLRKGLPEEQSHLLGNAPLCRTDVCRLILILSPLKFSFSVDVGHPNSFYVFVGNMPKGLLQENALQNAPKLDAI